MGQEKLCGYKGRAAGALDVLILLFLPIIFMASAYASPPQSTREMSPTTISSASTSAPKSSIETSLQALSQVRACYLTDCLAACLHPLLNAAFTSNLT